MILHGVEVKKFAGLSLPEHLEENDLATAYRKYKYRILVSKTSLNLLLYFLHENEAVGGGILIRIINQYLDPVISTTRPDKIDQEGEANPEEGISKYVADTNEVEKFNEQTVKLGKMPIDPEVSKEVEAELKLKDEKIELVNGKTLTEEFQEMIKPELDLPARESLPLPLKDANDIKKMILQVEDSRSKIKLGAIQASSPSVCMYTFHNTNNDMTCIEFNDDSTMAAAGFQDSYIKLWSLDGKPLKSVLKRDRHKPQDNTRKLIGHSGPVYGVSFHLTTSTFCRAPRTRLSDCGHWTHTRHWFRIKVILSLYGMLNFHHWDIILSLHPTIKLRDYGQLTIFTHCVYLRAILMMLIVLSSILTRIMFSLVQVIEHVVCGTYKQETV